MISGLSSESNNSFFINYWKINDILYFQNSLEKRIKDILSKPVVSKMSDFN